MEVWNWRWSWGRTLHPKFVVAIPMWLTSPFWNKRSSAYEELIESIRLKTLNKNISFFLWVSIYFIEYYHELTSLYIRPWYYLDYSVSLSLLSTFGLKFAFTAFHVLFLLLCLISFKLLDYPNGLRRLKWTLPSRIENHLVEGVD